MMAELRSLPNIGREMARKLTAVGISAPEQLSAEGAEQAFLRLKTRFPQVCLVHLYALEGAIRGMALDRLPEGRKQELKAFSHQLSQRPQAAPAGNLDEF